MHEGQDSELSAMNAWRQHTMMMIKQEKKRMRRKERLFSVFLPVLLLVVAAVVSLVQAREYMQRDLVPMYVAKIGMSLICSHAFACVHLLIRVPFVCYSGSVHVE